MATPNTLDAHTTRAVAVKAECDPRSVAKLVRGEPLASTTAARIRRALAELGLTPGAATRPANDSGAPRG